MPAGCRLVDGERKWHEAFDFDAEALRRGETGKTAELVRTISRWGGRGAEKAERAELRFGRGPQGNWGRSAGVGQRKYCGQAWLTSLLFPLQTELNMDCANRPKNGLRES
jgi:hypothetical protein